MSDQSDGVPVVFSEPNTKSIETLLIDTKTWFKLKKLLSNVIFDLPADSTDKREFLTFMALHWPGHAPRVEEFARLQKRLSAAEELLKIPVKDPIFKKKAKCPACGKMSRVTTAGCDHCGLEDK